MLIFHIVAGATSIICYMFAVIRSSTNVRLANSALLMTVLSGLGLAVSSNSILKSCVRLSVYLAIIGFLHILRLHQIKVSSEKNSNLV